MNPTIRHQHLATVPGEGILFPSSALAVPVAYRTWMEATGMEPEDIVLGSLCPIPLPRPGLRESNWASVPPQMLWCPLFWLPERLTERRSVELQDGTRVLESTDQLLVRIALELTNAGLYDVETGWVDALALFGIDIDTEQGVSRVRDWQQGVPDKTLTELSLDRWLDVLRVPDPEWSATACDEMFPTLSRAGWAVCADSLIDEAFYLTGAHAPQDPGELQRGLTNLCSLAFMQLEGTGLVAPDFFAEIEQSARMADVSSIMPQVYTPLLEALHRIRDMFWADLEEVVEATGAIGDQATPPASQGLPQPPAPAGSTR